MSYINMMYILIITINIYIIVFYIYTPLKVIINNFNTKKKIIIKNSMIILNEYGS